MQRYLLVLCAIAVAVLAAGCTGSGGCSNGNCGKSPAIGVSPHQGRYIEGGHGWR